MLVQPKTLNKCAAKDVLPTTSEQQPPVNKGKLESSPTNFNNIFV